MVRETAGGPVCQPSANEKKRAGAPQSRRWGFYSARHAAINSRAGAVRSMTIRTSNGNLAEVTHISTTPNPAAYLWNDAVPMGMLDLGHMSARNGAW